jgi:adenine-specific DNA-methyltransferase
MLAKNLLADDGVIFISIDDNEQANLKLLCDEIFGEGNFVEDFIFVKNSGGSLSKTTLTRHEYILCYGKNTKDLSNHQIFYMKKPAFDDVNNLITECKNTGLSIEQAEQRLKKFYRDNQSLKGITLYNKIDDKWQVFRELPMTAPNNNYYDVIHPITKKAVKTPVRGWSWSKETMKQKIKEGVVSFGKDENSVPRQKLYLYEAEKEHKRSTINLDQSEGNKQLSSIMGTNNMFDNPKPLSLLHYLFQNSDINSLILDFFAGSGTTGQAVMQLNAEDGGNRKFILCQIDEPIKEDKPAYIFCKDNKLPPAISSITCERLNRAGEKVKEAGGLLNDKLDVGYKVFDLVQSPHLDLEENEQMTMFDNEALTPLDRIYNLIFKIGIDDPAIEPQEILKDCLYLCESAGIKNYYITNSQELDKKENRDSLKKAILEGNVYIDGWTATLTTTLQEQKEKIQIIF